MERPQGNTLQLVVSFNFIKTGSFRIPRSPPIAAKKVHRRIRFLDQTYYKQLSKTIKRKRKVNKMSEIQKYRNKPRNIRNPETHIRNELAFLMANCACVQPGAPLPRPAEPSPIRFLFWVWGLPGRQRKRKKRRRKAKNDALVAAKPCGAFGEFE